MSLIDIVILLPIIFGLVRGFMRGVIKELTSIIGIVFGLVAARMFASDLTLWLQKFLAWDFSVLQVISYALIFLLVAISLNLAALVLKKILQLISLNWLNRLFGALFGAFKWALVVSVVINAVVFLNNKFSFLKPETTQASVLLEPTRKIAALAWEEMPSLTSSSSNSSSSNSNSNSSSSNSSSLALFSAVKP